MERLYRVTEFAKLAGITVRTLHHYHQLGLLAPETRTDGGQRLYAKGDLVRLQHILTLKWIGYDLKTIKAMLDAPDSDMQQLLVLQKQAVDAQIRQLQGMSEALGRAIDSGDELDNDAIQTIIQSVTNNRLTEWAAPHYSQATWAGVMTRGMQYTEADFQRFQQQWQDLAEAFDSVRHLAPDNPAVQQHAATMASYIDAFTAGDSETESHLANAMQDDTMPQGYKMDDADLQQFMGKALTIYRERQSR